MEERRCLKSSSFETMTSRKSQNCADIVVCQFRKVCDDLVCRHSRGEILKHIADRDPHAANKSLPERLPGSMVMMPLQSIAQT